MMQPVPIDKHELVDTDYTRKQLDSEPTNTSYEGFMYKCVELYATIPNIELVDYNLLKYGNIKDAV